MVQIIPKDDPKQTLRIKRFLMAFDTYIIWMLIALYCYYDGLFTRMPWPIYWTFSLIIMTNLFFFFLIRSGLNKRFEDPSLTMIQMVLATVWIMYMAYCLDEGRGILLLLYMVVFTFGTFRLSFRQFFILSVLALLGYGFVITLLLINHPKIVNLREELLYSGTLFTVLIWFSFIGSYINGLRKKLIKSNDELNNASNELQEVNALIKQSEERFRSLIQKSTDIILVIDGKKYVTYATPSLTSILGYPPGYFVGKSPFEFIHPADLQRVTSDLNAVYLKTNPGIPTEFRCRKADGTWVYLEAIGQNLLEDPAINGIVITARDITERKQAEEALKKSEEHYRIVAENARDVIWVFDLNLGYTFVTSSVQQLRGYTVEEALKQSIDQVLTPESYQKAKEIFDREFALEFSGQQHGPEWSITSELEMIRKDGSTVWTEVTMNIVYNENGEPSGIMGITRDITERKHAEEVLRESERRYRILIEQAVDGIYVMDRNGKYLLVNSKFCKMLGYAEGELLGLNFLDTYPDELRDVGWQRLARVTSGESLRFERPMKRKDGTIFQVEISASSLEDGRHQGFIHDITERKLAEEENKRLEDQLVRAQKMEAIGTLAGGIAHDFNNLLMGILGNISIMRMNFDDSHPFFDRLTHMEEYVQRGSDLTKQLLGFAQGGKYEIIPTHLGEFIQKSSEMFGRTKKEIRIHHKVPEALWSVEVDRGQMEQVLLNLYVNAWQAMPGGGDLYLSVENVDLDDMDVSPFGVKPGKYVKMTITDTGVGMDEATKARIFEPFYTTKERGRGTGLGLASVYGIIKNHGGFINVESEKHLGTSFLIFLPASDRNVVYEYMIKEAVQKGQETVLFIDDEDMVLDVGSEMIKGLGYEVMTATGGKQGLEIYEQNRDKIDLVILDMIMPDISGKDTFNALQRINPSVRVLLSSGYSLDGQAKEIMQDGCKAFIQKPFTMSELSNKIRGILDQ